MISLHDIQNLWTVLGPLSGAGIGKVIDHYLKLKRLKLFKRKDPVVESVKNNILIENKLDEILNDFEADRVYLLQFHNGGNFYPSGKSIPKFSVFYEKSSLGVPIIREKFQNIPVSIFSKFFNYVSENNISYYQDLRKATLEDFEERGFTRDTDAKSTYCASIRTIDDKFMGVIVIHYVKRKRSLSESKLTEIQIHASSIGSVLSVHQNDQGK